MKVALSLFLLIFCSQFSLTAQTFYSVNYKSDAKVKVFVANYKSDADLLVYK